MHGLVDLKNNYLILITSVIPRRISMAAYSEGFQIAVLNVTDADSGKDGQVSYSILNGNAFVRILNKFLGLK